MVYRIIQPRKTISPTTKLRFAAADLIATVNTGPRFALGSTGWTQTSVADAGALVFQLPFLPTYSKLLSASFRLMPVTHVGLPGTMPQFQVSKILDGFAAQLGATTVDPSATVAAYNLPHTVTVEDLNFRLKPDLFDFVQVIIAGEAGANSILGMRVVWVELQLG